MHECVHHLYPLPLHQRQEAFQSATAWVHDELSQRADEQGGVSPIRAVNQNRVAIPGKTDFFLEKEDIISSCNMDILKVFVPHLSTHSARSPAVDRAVWTLASHFEFSSLLSQRSMLWVPSPQASTTLIRLSCSALPLNMHDISS